MQLGLALPNVGDAVDSAYLLDLAVGAESIGLDSVWVADRWLRPRFPVVIPGVPAPVEIPAEQYRTVYDPIDVLSAIAARTSRIQLGTSAINVLYHPPVLLARRLATLDQISGGRVIAGVTSGWMAEEFAVAGVPSASTGPRFVDHLNAMNAVWGPDPVVYDGKYFRIPESDIGPKPHQQGGFPIVAGYATEAGLRRVASLGLGLHPFRNEFDSLTNDLENWRRWTTSAGHDADSLPVILRCSASLKPDGDTFFSADLEASLRNLQRLASLGIDHVFPQFPADTPDDAILERMQALLRTT